MKKKSKGLSKKSGTKNKKTGDPEPPAAGLNIVEAKFLAWKMNAKPSKLFPFLDAQLFADFLGFSSNPSSINTSTGQQSIRLKSAMKYLNTIKYIEQHSELEELDSILHNISFIYDIDRDALRNEVGSIKKLVKKVPNNVLLEQYLKQLDNNDFQQPRIVIIEDLDTDDVKEIEKIEPAPKPKKNRKKAGAIEGAVDLKEVTDIKDLEILTKKGKSAPQKAEKKSKFDEAMERQADGEDSLKKKVKVNNSSAKEVIAEAQEIDSEQEIVVDKKARPKKTKEKLTKKTPTPKDMIVVKIEHDAKEKKKPTKSFKNGKSLAEEVKQHATGEYMELLINNEIDDDKGEGLNFFFVNENVHNKTKQYFEKKPRPEQVCSCVGGCNDPTICPCARMNFENCGKTACYVFDTKSGKKRLLNNLIRKDMHIYECSPQCACAKSMCFNSCIAEGAVNRPAITDFIIERYNKVYNGQDPTLKGMASIMWGLKARTLIPANTYVVEYCGEIITKKEGDRRGEKYDSVNCNYLFDLNKHAEIEIIDESNNTITLNIDGICETRNMGKLKDIAMNFPLVIDAYFYGNHSRFVNHSCNPNMVALAVHTENRNILLPRIIFFALRDIQPGEELTIDYNCAPLKDLKNTEKLTCLCGAPNCRGFVYEEAQDEM